MNHEQRQLALSSLLAMSHRYGGPAYVLAGGGNTSIKDDDVLLVKASGSELATLREDQVTALDRHKLADIPRKAYPEDFDAREAAALADLMAARLPGETARPSVEALLHDVLPFRYVCHVHPAQVNALTCAKQGEAALAHLFPDALWTPAIMPGYVLAMALKRQLDEAHAHGGNPSIVFLQNHGVFVGADSPEAIDATYARIMATLEGALPETDAAPTMPSQDAAVPAALRMLLWDDGAYVRALPFIFERREDFQAQLIVRLTPDHMVYCGAQTLWLDALPDGPAQLPSARIIGVKGVGVYACGATLRECDAAHDFALDAHAIYRMAASFGGAQPMPEALAEAIAGWEVERYRKAQVMTRQNARAAGKIAIVTGAAQGFGLGIAQGLASEGAVVVLADLNLEGAQEAAQAINATFGKGRALAVRCDVGSDSDVAALMAATVSRYGGIDVLISNAGIVRAGGLDDLTPEAFDLSTRVNYTAFFLCAKHAARVMKVQRRYRPQHSADIIQINSKSGLSGSNRNFAYAGAKFGGIGLVQSFALELAGDGIKVNAVCPGNFLDGPLWSHPENGLFVQYLRAGKVPGAKTAEDVRRFYEAKVPMGRGCRIEDAVRAILYAMEQAYETGQAIPVTGGQEMLH